MQKVLEATVEELSVKGLAGLSIEEVADRAGVAKTTVYRRWPTRVDLAMAAMHQVADDIIHAEDTGSLCGDLTALLRSFRDFAWSPRGQGLIRTMMSDVMHTEVAELARRIREEKSHATTNIIARAIERGELPAGTDARLFLDTAFAAVQSSCLMHEPVSDARIAQIIDLLLIGAQHGGAIVAPASRPNGAPAQKRKAKGGSARPSRA